MHPHLAHHAIEYGTWKPLSYWKGVDIEESRQEFELEGIVFTAIGYLPDYVYGGLEEEPYQEEAVVIIETN